MRADHLRLQDMLQAADSILHFVRGKDRELFRNDALLQSAVLHQLSVMTEAARSISAEIKGTYPMVQWAEIAGFRNVLVHQYFALDLDIIWETVSRSVPQLRDQICEILQREFPEGDLKN